MNQSVDSIELIKLKNDLKKCWLPIFIVVIYMISTQLLFGYMCPFKLLLHIDCPGCGLTRATIALFSGNIHKSLQYNYSCIFWLLTLILFFIDRYIKPLKVKPFPVLFIITCIITIVRYVLIVVFNEPIF